MIGPNGAGKSTFFKMLTCEVAPTSGKIVFEGRDITGKSVTDVCQLGLTKSYQVNQLFTRLDGAREPDRSPRSPNCAANSGSTCSAACRRSPASASRSSRRWSWCTSPTARIRRFRSLPTARSGGSKSVWRWRRSPSLLLLDEPLAGMSPRERVETVKLLKSIGQGRTMIIIDHDMDALFELVRARHGAAGGPRAGRRHAGRDQGQQDGAGSLSGRSARGMSLLEVDRPERLLWRFAHPVRRRAARRAQRGGGACSAATAPARARP